MSGSGDKSHWRLPTPFRRFSGKQCLRPKSRVVHSRSRVSSVYLCDDTSTSGFIVVPEFDSPVRAQTTHEDPIHTSHPPKLPAVTSSDLLPSNSVDSYIYDFEPIVSHHSSSSLGPGSNYASFPNTNWDDDFSQRLGSAYEHIRSMSSAASPIISLSADPQMLRKQLGVPQHSVLNYPIHSSPDLPNPHTFPQLMSPKLPPAASSDMSHAGMTKKHGLCINTSIYSISPCHGSPDPFHRVERNPTVNTPTLTVNSPSQYRTLEVPWHVHIACTPNSLPSVSNPSKLTKRRVEKPTLSPPFLPSSRRRALKSVLRKPPPNTAPSTNALKWQTSLPQIRPSSPFKVDIPLHHTWHDRRTNFNPSFERHSESAQFHPTKSRTNGNTEVLASLAWIGTPPMRLSSYTANRRCYLSNPELPDHFSMAIAVEDDSISDDALVDRLEKARRIGSPSEHGRDVSPSSPPDSVHLLGTRRNEIGSLHTSCRASLLPTHGQLAKSRGTPLPSPLITQDAPSDLDDAEVWRAARKALLCIREIVRTEKKYQEAMKMLLNAQTVTPPPSSMVPYISALVQVSETLLKCFLEDPSAWGVSTGFVTSEDELEATMVSWCAVAGAFFMDGNDPQSSRLIGRWRHRKSGMSSASSSVTKQTSISLSPRLSPTMFPIVSTGSKNKERMDNESGAWRDPQTEQERQIAFVSPQKRENSKNQILTGQSPSRKLSVRDLAIQPIQRVMRYVLLYRDLLDCTPPTSPSHLLVERALEAATRIANHCDSAQSNPAFFHAS